MQDRPQIVAPALPSVDDSAGMKLLPFVLSIIAGSVDVIGFLGLGGLFTAHVTGNLAILAAKLVANDPAPVSEVIAVPVFMIVVGITTWVASALSRIGVASLLPLLALQFLLLLALTVICLTAAPRADPATARMIFAGMLGVSAMAVQNALARISLKDAPSTAVMTTNITVFVIDIATMLLDRGASRAATARNRAGHTFPAIAGFVLGCTLGAAFEPTLGLASLQIPTVLALVAFALGLGGRAEGGTRRHACRRAFSVTRARIDPT